MPNKDYFMKAYAEYMSLMVPKKATIHIHTFPGYYIALLWAITGIINYMNFRKNENDVYMLALTVLNLVCAIMFLVMTYLSRKNEKPITLIRTRANTNVNKNRLVYTDHKIQVVAECSDEEWKKFNEKYDTEEKKKRLIRRLFLYE